MIIQKDTSLKQFNTFNVEAFAKYFCEIQNFDDLEYLKENEQFKNERKLILGGGSNILFENDFNGIVIKNNIGGINIISETDEDIIIEVGAGHDWDKLVEQTINSGYYGLENLSLIPGTVGASPIQNIGAYGVEVKDVIESVNFVSLENFEHRTFSNSQCQFDYRNSIFKNELKDKLIVTSVLFNLSKVEKTNIEYTALQNYFSEKRIPKITANEIRNAVMEIRRSKLPDPQIFGNAGSFFKNPIISNGEYEKIKSKYPDLNGYKVNDNSIKIPAGWLIEKSGLKGKRFGNVGIYEKQALVIVNYGNATGVEIVEFSKMIQNEVEDKFNVKIINEVNII